MEWMDLNNRVWSIFSSLALFYDRLLMGIIIRSSPHSSRWVVPGAWELVVLF